MRAFFNIRVDLASLIRAILLLCLLSCSSWVAAQPVLVISPLTWNVIGLDSNNTSVGPNTFPVGARVCNTGTLTATTVTASITLGAGSTAINLAPGPTTIVYGDLQAGAAAPSQYAISTVPANCTDFYYTVAITRVASSYNKTRSFQITASATNATSVSTPANREVYVEKLISQNRNSITSITGPSTVFVGDTYTYSYVTKTAPGGYEQVENFINWPNAIYQVLSVTSTYSQPVGAVNSSPYADGCGWENDPASPDYRSCGPLIADNYTAGKAGGDIVTTYVVKVILPGTASITGVVHDYSGSSYHYNSDFGDPLKTVSITSRYRQSDLAITKTDNKTSVISNTSNTYTVVVTNSGPDGAVTTTIADPAVVGLNKTSVTCVAAGGTACPATVTVAALEAGLVISSAPVNSTLTLTIVVTVTASSGTVTNVATVSPGPFVIDPVMANNTASDADVVRALVNVTIAKTNGTTTVVAGSTTSYTVTISNLGPGAADGAVVTDVPGTGLNCTAVRCTAITGPASCPVSMPLNTTVASGATAFFGAGESIPTLGSGSTINFLIDCGVQATGQ